MHFLFFLFGSVCCLAVVLDAFQTIILPRRPTGRFRITRLFYITTWHPWAAFAERVQNRRIREQIYSIFGPISLLLLLVLWASLLILGFGCIYFALGSPFVDPLAKNVSVLVQLRTNLYVSGTTLFTLGLGDVTPNDYLVRTFVVLESGTGLAFVALVIGYVPVIYQAFSKREVSVALLDGRAGSPPTAAELLRRHGYEGGDADLTLLLAEWERWSAEILESHISYPLLCYYRSQHDNQSWLSAMTAILDACALVITTTTEGPTVRQAQLTFAMARHALIDLGHVFGTEEYARKMGESNLLRLTPSILDQMCEMMSTMHMQLCTDPASVKRLTAIRLLYEPHAHALASYLRMPLPLWVAEPRKNDSWKQVADLRRSSDEASSKGGPDFSHSFATHLNDEDGL